jgi:ATP-binding cassette, subfamily B, bacterial
MVDAKKALDPLHCLPKELIEHLDKQRRDAVLAATPYDLDAHGMYAEGYLLLTLTGVGHYTQPDPKSPWTDTWYDMKTLDEADLVEGLGISVLRLVREGQTVAEFRFTQRHAKLVVRFHRHLEHVLAHDEDEELEPLPPERIEDKRSRCDKCDRFIPAWSDVCQACMSRRKILFRLLDFVKPNKGRAIAAFLVALTMTTMGMITPSLSKPLTDDGLGAATGKSADFSVVLTIVGLMAGLLLLNCIGQWAQLRLSMEVARRMARSVRHTVYEHLHKLSLSFFAKRQTGSLITRVTNDTERLWSFVATVAIDMVLSLLTIVGVGLCLFLWNWKLAMCALIPIPLMAFLTVIFHKRLRRSFRQQWHRFAQMTAVVADALPGVRVIKAFSQEKREVDRFEEKSTALFNEESNYIRGVRSIFGPIMMLCTGMGTLIIWIVGGWMLANGKDGMTVGTIVMFQLYMGMFLRPIHQIAHMDDQLNRAATSAQRIFEILDSSPDIYSSENSRPAHAIEGAIELQNVSFSYDGVHKVLKNINLSIKPGEMIGLAGPSGGGKTTTVNLISRFYDVQEGAILIDGVDVRDYDVAPMRQKIGVVLQEPFLFHGTICENIAYGNPDATLDDIINAARAANANDFIVGFPDGYDTMVGERGQSLSGGERQRISIARAILSNPAILILDEATSSVDTETEELIQQALDTLTENRTTIAIAHRLSTLRKADRLVILEKGEMAEQGTHEELANKEGGIYAKLLNMQQKSQSYIALTGN